MSRQAALVAQTDRALAAIADAIREEFGGDAALAGRVLASTAPQVNHLASQLQALGADMSQVPSVLADLLGLAAEELCREGGAP